MSKEAALDQEKKAEDSDESPKRAKRKFDSTNGNQTEDSSKKLKTDKDGRRNSDVQYKTPIRGNKTPKTPKVEAKLPDDDLNTKMNIEKIKELQKREISLIEREGTYVQCSRFVSKYYHFHLTFAV